MFLDQAIITVRAGKGGDGRVAFRREKFEPKGGPNGGNGGNGANVVVVAELGLSTLHDFQYRKSFIAPDGEGGGNTQCTGADGTDVEIRLPPGTLIFNHSTGELIHDLLPGERVVIARGGKGGWGNEHFKSSIYQAPREAEAGGMGEAFTIRLELKLIADVGFLGMPNAGKSTLLASLTRANPKIGDYPFTTLSPQLGITELDATRRIVLADIPGLIEGASTGAGLGLDFLRHVERTRVLLHLLDLEPTDGSDPIENYRVIRAELAGYSEALAEKKELIVFNKIDLLPDEKVRQKKIGAICKALKLNQERDTLSISGATKQNLKPLLERLWRMLHPGSPGGEGWKDE